MTRKGRKSKISRCGDKGGPACGNTSFDVLPHFVHRRILIKSIPTWGLFLSGDDQDILKEVVKTYLVAQSLPVFFFFFSSAHL
jgi:hypothetical protein